MMTAAAAAPAAVAAPQPAARTAAASGAAPFDDALRAFEGLIAELAPAAAEGESCRADPPGDTELDEDGEDAPADASALASVLLQCLLSLPQERPAPQNPAGGGRLPRSENAGAPAQPAASQADALAGPLQLAADAALFEGDALATAAAADGMAGAALLQGRPAADALSETTVQAAVQATLGADAPQLIAELAQAPAAVPAAAASAPASALGMPPLRADEPHWAENLGERVLWMAEAAEDGAQALQEARIDLHPAEWGSLQIRIQIGADGAQVSFSADSAQARQAIEQSLPRLRELLAAQGFGSAQFDVGGGSSGRGSARDSAPRSRLRTEAEAAEPLPPLRAVRLRAGMLDDFA